MNLIDQIFWRCVDAIEHLGNLSGLGYELTNIILFVIIQPLLILVFLFLWLKERRKNKNLISHNLPSPKSKLIDFFWRLSRLLSILVLGLELLIVYSIYFNAFTLPIKSVFGTGLMQYFSVIFPIAILLTYNFLVFGKVTIWLKRP